MSKQKLSIGGRNHKNSGNAGVKNNITAEDCYRQISEAAYYLSEKQGFASGCEIDDWLRAEAEVKSRIQKAFQ